MAGESLASSELKGVLRLDSIETVSNRKNTRMIGNISIKKNLADGPRTRRIELYFEVPKKYGKYLLTERCDAFVVLFLHSAISKGYDIESSVPMSSDLYYNVVEHLIPILSRKSEYSVKLDTPVADPPEAGFAVGTGLSCGVDSMSAVKMYVDHPCEDLKLTHLCINNVGAFNVMYSDAGAENVKKAAYDRAKAASKMIGLPLIQTDSNLLEVFPMHHLYTHSYSSMFAVLCLSKLWKTYYYASSGLDHATNMDLDGWDQRDSSSYELLLFRYLSTRRLMVYSAGEMDNRLDKLRSISDYNVAQKYLYSCTASDHNCGVCDKCIRNLTGLDSIGKLDEFSEAFDIERYRNARGYFMAYVSKRRSEEMFKPIFDAFVESGDEGMKTAIDVDMAIVEFDMLWAEKDPESDVLAAKVLKPYKYISVRAATRMAKAYSQGRGVKKSPKLERRCYNAIESMYRNEIANGMERSRFQLFDFLWNRGRYDELLEVIEPQKDKDNGRFRYAKMYYYGVGLEKDVEKAYEIMLELVKKNPKFQSSYHTMFPKSSRS